MDMTVTCFHIDRNFPATEIIIVVTYKIITECESCTYCIAIPSESAGLVLFKYLIMNIIVFISTGSALNMTCVVGHHNFDKKHLNYIEMHERCVLPHSLRIHYFICMSDSFSNVLFYLHVRFAFKFAIACRNLPFAVVCISIRSSDFTLAHVVIAFVVLYYADLILSVMLPWLKEFCLLPRNHMFSLLLW